MKVLFITYYWPPAGGTPINRIFKFYQYLHEFGWEPVILTSENGDFPFVDESLLKEVRPETKIYRSKNISMHKFFKKVSPGSTKNFIPYGFTDTTNNSFMDNLSRWVKYNFIPDTRFPWYFRSVKKAIQICKDEKIDVIFSSSPPQTNHIIAAKVAKKLNIPLVSDFRDPWTDVFWVIAENSARWKIIQRLDRGIERRTIAKMDVITCFGTTMEKILRRKTDKPIQVIYNGFDEKYFDRADYKKEEKFRIIYFGSMSKEQPPASFFNTMELLKDNKEFFDKVDILFLGNFPAHLHNEAEKSSFSSRVRFMPYMNYSDSLKVMTNCELSLLIMGDTKDNESHLSLKMYEYLGAGHPVIGYGPPKGEAAVILNETGIGKMFDFTDYQPASEYILEIFERWKVSENLFSETVLENTRKFSRRNLTKQLAGVLDSCVKKD
ncbi:MAG: glycosyltransferase family 4 protein [Bacteroidota bacterium]